MALLIFYLLLALIVSFFCSLLEAILLSITPNYIESQMSKGKKWAATLLEFKKDIDRPLASILSLNTISHTVGAAGVGAQAGKVFENISVGIISGALTLLILVFSELIPKTIGAIYWKRLAFFATQSLKFLNIIMYPLVVVSQLITRLFRSDKKEPSVDRSEVIALAEIGRREGVFTQTEARILQNLVRLRSVSVRDIMTPRMVMVAAKENQTVEEFVHDERFKSFSRIPIYAETRDHVTGFVHKHDVMITMSEGKGDTCLVDLKRDLPLVDEDQNIYKLYSYLTENNFHIALVTEEYGGTAGLVTMEDVLETLLGLEIMDEFDDLEDLQKYARDRWKNRASRLGITIIEDDEAADQNRETPT